MTDYISREAAIRCCTFGRTSLGLISELRRIPAADVREVVLCRDCTHFEPFRAHDGFCKISGMLENNDFFCAHGQKKDGADMRGEAE